MFRATNHTIIGITTDDIAMLGISMPAIARIGKKHTLIVHNANPAIKISRRHIRRMGYRGRVHIINSAESTGLCRARMEIVDAATRIARRAKWIIFVCAGDVLISADVAPAGADNFAIIKNAISVHRFSDLIHAAYDAQIPTPDGQNTLLYQPSLMLRGMPIRLDIMRHMTSMAMAEMAMTESDAASVDKMMWGEIRQSLGTNSAQTALFMDTTSYIINDIDVAYAVAAAPRG